MKKKIILLPVVALLGYLVLTGSSNGPGNGGYGDRTGATASTVGCGGGCHATAASSSTSVTVALYDATGTTLITTGYVGGTTYKIRIGGVNNSTTVLNLKKFGFQVSAVKTTSTSTNEGTFTAPAGTHSGTYAGIKIVEHSSPITPSSGTGGTGTVYTVPDITWVAPLAGTGSITIFTTLNAVNSNGNQDNGDLWNNTSLVVPESSGGVAAITGTMTVCVGATTALTDATPGGTWSSTSPTIATIGTSGIVTGVSTGTSVIKYNAGTSGIATATVTVISATPTAIVGPTVVCVGTHIVLSDAVSGGVWTSSNTAMATAGSSTGVVTGVGVGTSVIQYSVTNSCGTGSVSQTVTVRALGGTCVSGVNTLSNPLQSELKVYPNPNWGTFNLNLASENNEQAFVTVTNLVGAKVKEFTTVTNKETEIRLDNAAPGIYFITASTLQGKFVAKFIVE